MMISIHTLCDRIINPDARALILCAHAMNLIDVVQQADDSWEIVFRAGTKLIVTKGGAVQQEKPNEQS